MNREELIEEAAKAMHTENRPSSLNEDQWDATWGASENAYRALAQAALAVFEKAQCKRCGKLAEGYAFIGDDRYCHPDDGVDCYTLASHELTSLANQAFIEKAQTPTYGERGALPIAPCETWNWDTCVVCGSKEVSDRGMVIMGASNGAPYAARIAWCDQSQECREDLRQTSFLLTEFDAKMIDKPEGGEGVTRPAQTEPTDAQVQAAIQGRYAAFRQNVNATETHLMRAALIAAFTAGKEEQS